MTPNEKPIIMKFGGASLATPELVLRAAQTIKAARARGPIIAVVSAMGDETDRLVGLVHQINPEPEASESDAVLAAGEQVSAGLVALALCRLGVNARSFLAHQLPLVTDGRFGDATILGVGTSPLKKALAADVVPVVTGFQGVNSESRLVTLGRGGSDSTAVAIAAAMRASHCEFYKDVDGVYSADPKTHRKARLLSRLSLSEMIRLAEREPQILHLKAVRMAHELGVHLRVRSAFRSSPGTLIVPENLNAPMEEMYA